MRQSVPALAGLRTVAPAPGSCRLAPPRAWRLRRRHHSRYATTSAALGRRARAVRGLEAEPQVGAVREREERRPPPPLRRDHPRPMARAAVQSHRSGARAPPERAEPASATERRDRCVRALGAVAVRHHGTDGSVAAAAADSPGGRRSRPAPRRRSTTVQAAPRPEQSFKDLFDTLAGTDRARAPRQAARGPPLARVPVRRGPPPDRGRPRRRQDVAGEGDRARRSAARGGASSSRPTCCRPTSPACRSGTARRNDFEFRPGGVFANVVLADEINRASPKTQSALLEAMEERQVTVDAQTYQLPRPFMVIATQNPVELEGTYPLPEAQLDRFLLRLRIGYPDRDAELAILDAQGDDAIDADELEPVTDAETVAALDRTSSAGCTSRPSCRATSSTSSRRPVTTAISCSA